VWHLYPLNVNLHYKKNIERRLKTMERELFFHISEFCLAVFVLLMREWHAPFPLYPICYDSIKIKLIFFSIITSKHEFKNWFLFYSSFFYIFLVVTNAALERERNQWNYHKPVKGSTSAFTHTINRTILQFYRRSKQTTCRF
jgi:hypothetical protein